MTTPKKGRPFTDPKAGPLTNFTVPLHAVTIKELHKQAKEKKDTATAIARKAIEKSLK